MVRVNDLPNINHLGQSCQYAGVPRQGGLKLPRWFLRPFVSRPTCVYVRCRQRVLWRNLNLQKSRLSAVGPAQLADPMERNGPFRAK